MKVEVEIGKKYFIGIVAVMLIIAGTFFVVSYNSNPPVPATFGHSANEIQGLNLSNICLSNGTNCPKTTFVGCTSTKYRGNLGGYSGADAKCAAEFSGSRMCNSNDMPQIINSISEGCYGVINTFDTVCASISTGEFQSVHLSCDCNQWSGSGYETHIQKYKGYVYIDVIDCGGLASLICCKD